VGLGWPLPAIVHEIVHTVSQTMAT
jgi:hypothetical protein